MTILQHKTNGQLLIHQFYTLHKKCNKTQSFIRIDKSDYVSKLQTIFFHKKYFLKHITNTLRIF